jgi:TonB family protein
MFGLSIKLSTLALILVSTVVTAPAQEKTCDLELKVFSYDALNSPKKRLVNVKVQLKGAGADQESNLSDVSTFAFRNLREGTYKLEFQKSGYKKRSKQVELDCDLVDEENAVLSFIYLWRDRKTPVNDGDLVADANGGSGARSDTEVPKRSSEDKIFGKVNLKVVIDEDGNVISASRIDGDRKLADRAMKMARRAKFAPTLVNGEPYQVSGSLTYNFVP